MHEFADWLQRTAASNTIQSVSWVIPLVQSIHILMIGVVFVSSLMIALRHRQRLPLSADHVWPGVLIKMRQTRTRLRSPSPKIVLTSMDVTTSRIRGRLPGETWRRCRPSGLPSASGASTSGDDRSRCP